MIERVRRTAVAVGLIAVLGPAGLAGCTSAAGSEGDPPVTPASAPSPGASAPAGSRTTQSQTGSAPIPLSATDWPTYHRSNDRAGAVPGLRAVRAVQPAWTRELDGSVYGQLLVLGGLAIVATEGNTVYGLDLPDGRIRWQRNLGLPAPRSSLPCGNIDPLGITGTPAYDPGTGSVYVVAETVGAHHVLVALDARTGVVRFRRSMDVTDRDRYAEQQRGALVVAGGRVYVPFGGLAGDCGNYVGYVTATPVRGDGPTMRYEVPTRREGGIWAPSGVAVDGAGDVWVAVGNGASVGDPYDGSDSVLRLSGDLGRRLDFFAPSDWGSQNAADADLGSTGPLLIGGDRVLISGKVGLVYLVNAGRLGGIGGQVASLPGCTGFGGMAWDASVQAAFVPCDEGVLRVDVGSGGPSALRAGWRAAGNVTGSPVVGGGLVWTLDPDGGRLYLLAEDTGQLRLSVATGRTSRFASPVVSGRYVLVPTLTGVTVLTAS